MPSHFDFNTLSPRINLNEYHGTCSASNPEKCVALAYSKLLETHDGISIGDIYAITYTGELEAFRVDSTAVPYSYEALARSFFDPQTGACPNGDEESCTAANMIRYLTTSQHWRDSVTRSGDVNMKRLLKNSRYVEYRHEIIDATNEHFSEWRTGQSPSRPSIWGNAYLLPGETSYPYLEGIEYMVITHVYEHGYSFNSDLREEVPLCSYVSVIATTQGRIVNPEEWQGC